MLAIDPHRRGAQRIRTGLLTLLAVAVSSAASAATITVNSTADAISNDNECTLREAIEVVNSGAGSAHGCTLNGAGDVVVDFATALANTAGTGGSTTQDGSKTPPTIKLDADKAPLIIKQPVTVNGKIELNGNVIDVTIDAQGSKDHPNRAFKISAQTTLKNLGLTDGYASSDGGLLLVDVTTKAKPNDAALTIESVALTNGTAAAGGLGGAIYVRNGSLAISNSFIGNNFARSGGGIWTNSTTTIKNSFLSNNSATSNTDNPANAKGGHVYVTNADLTITQSRLQTGLAVADPDHKGTGGAVYMDGGTLTVVGGLISNNYANTAGGAIALRNGAVATIERTAFKVNGLLRAGLALLYTKNGGTIHALNGATLTLKTGTIIGSSANHQGGAIWSKNTNIVIKDFEIRNSVARGVAKDTDSTGDGGAIYYASSNNNTLKVTDSRIIGNIAGAQTRDTTDKENGAGGALFIDGGAVTIKDSHLARNSALSMGGAIAVKAGTVNISTSIIGGNASNDGNIAYAKPGKGGAIHIAAGTVTVKRSTIAYNTASQGGGLWNSAASTLMLVNSTVSNNQATGNGALTGDGGGLYQQPGGATTIQFTTIANNRSAGTGGGIAVGGDTPNGEVTVSGSIITDNQAAGDDNVATGSVSDGTQPNIIFPTAGLDSLQYLSGTLVHPLLPNSAAIDYENPATNQTINCSLAQDQRGITRDAECDLGSFEAAPDAAAVKVTANGPDQITTNGQQDTTVLAFTVANSSDSNVTISGFAAEALFNTSYSNLRPLLLKDDGSGQARPFQVVIDENGNGLLDTADNRMITPTGGSSDLEFDLSQCNSACVLSATGTAGDSLDLLVVIPGSGGNTGNQMVRLSSMTPLYAGGMLLGLIAALSLTGVRRRTRLALALAVIAIGLTACSNAEGPPPPYPDVFGDSPELAGELRYQLVRVGSQHPNTSNKVVVAAGLPVYGPAIIVQ